MDIWALSRLTVSEIREELRKQSKPRERLPNTEELLLLKNAVLLPILLEVVQSNLKKIEMTTLTLKKMYTTVTEVIMKQIKRDIADANRTLRELNLKIIDDEHTYDALCIRFTCRGYSDSLTVTRELIKAELGIKTQLYVEDVLKRLAIN